LGGKFSTLRKRRCGRLPDVERTGTSFPLAIFQGVLTRELPWSSWFPLPVIRQRVRVRVFGRGREKYTLTTPPEYRERE